MAAKYRNLSDADLWSQLALAQMVQKRYPPTSREWKQQSRKIHALARENKRRYGPRAKNPAGSSGPTKAEVISALHRDFSGNYAAAARYAEQVARQGGRDADTYRQAAEWLRKAAKKNPRGTKFDACVRKVKARRSRGRKRPRNPYAICAAATRRNSRPRVTARQRTATAKFHERVAAAFAATGQAENAAQARRAARLVRRPRRNPSRYKARGEYIITAQKKGGKVLRLVEGNKFAESGRPVVFPTQRSASVTARWLRRLYSVLKAYNPTATPR